ncbi:MAG TPA: amino acid adenylation domain-containing protein [Ktedonobacteraceae bacterium]
MTDLAKRLARLSPEQRAHLESLLNQGQPSAPDTQIAQREKASDLLPLSFEQQRLWFVDQLTPGHLAYNSPLAVQLRGLLAVSALQQGLNQLIERHEVLRTTFTLRDGQPIQVIEPAFALSLPVDDLSALRESEREAVATRIANEQARRSFDLRHGPVLRAQLLRLRSDHHILLLTLHHIAVDAWSLGVFFRELAALYNAYRGGQPSPLPARSLQYADYALWQRQTLQGAALADLLTYWRQHLAGLPTLALPTDHPRPPDLAHQGAKCSLTLPQAVKEALLVVGRQEQSTLFMTMLAAYQMVLARYSGQAEIVLGSSVAGRSRAELEDLIGFFVNLLVLRTDLSGGPSLREVLRRVREECLQAYAHQDLPFACLVEALHPARDLAHTPFFQVLFQSIEGPGERSEFAGLALEPFASDTATAKFDLLVSIREADQGIIVEVEYNTALFEAQTIWRMLGHYQILLAELAAHPDQSLKTVPLLSSGERQTLLETWNQTQIPYPDHLCLHELFEAQVVRHPRALALISADQQLTYAQLNARANQLAWYLQSLGVGPEVIVGLCVERSVEMVVGLLGILKAGGAYAPLDPTYPKARLALLLAQTASPVVLTQEKLLPDLPVHTAVVVLLDTDWPRIAQENDGNPQTGVSPEYPAYIISTSGSTGVPRGIIVPHRGVVNNITDLNRRFSVAASDSILVLSSLSFDMCVYEVLGTLEAGATMILPPPLAARDPACWADLLLRHRVTLWNSAPSLLTLLIEYCEQTPPVQPLSLRLALLGGDWIPVTLPDRLKALAPQVQFISLGGATEASIHSTLYQVTASDPSWKSIPYGRPMANQHTYILDANLQLVPKGIPGELYLAGAGLTRGYLSRPALTAEKFLPHPFSQRPGERLYKTGDLARYRFDGNIELLGRMDLLVKIHGLRIELGEIEFVLRHHPALQDVVVLVKADRSGDKYLVAYAVLQHNAVEPAAAELRFFLSGRLPEYMQPRTFVFLETLPLSPNGKVDRRGLPEPDQEHPQTRRALLSPRDALETRIARVWSAVLGIEHIGIDENFFDLGGDSFKAIRAARACSDTLALIDFFKNATIRQIAAYLRQKSEQARQLLFELTRSSTQADLSLVCIPYGGGNVVSYQPLADKLPQGSLLYALALPGHDFARRDEPLLPLAVVAGMCVEEIIQTIKQTPLALYGQCAGVALTIEIARLLEQRNVPLKAIYLGAALPDREPGRSLQFERGLSDEQMLEWLQWLGGFADRVEPEETRQIVNAVRHDLVNAARYYKEASASPARKLRTPVTCIIGTEDAATRGYETRFQEWGHFAESVRLVTLQGAGHYFVKHQASELARVISAL